MKETGFARLDHLTSSEGSIGSICEQDFPLPLDQLNRGLSTCRACPPRSVGAVVHMCSCGLSPSADQV